MPILLFADGKLSAQDLSQAVNRDVWHYAVQIGRLDMVSALLTILGIMVGTGAIFGFLYHGIKAREIAENVAREEAQKVAEELAGEAKQLAENIATQVATEQVKGLYQKGDLNIPQTEQVLISALVNALARQRPPDNDDQTQPD